MLLVPIVLLALLLGFAAHRASVCAVRAVAEAAHARTLYMLASMVKSSLWVMLVLAAVLWQAPGALAGFGGWALTGGAVLGGLAFGFGAGINGACAYSTMARLVDGEGGMLATIAGFALGIAAFLALNDAGWLARPSPAPAALPALVETAAGTTQAALLLPLALLALVAAWEIRRLWWRRPAGSGLRALLLAPQYRLSTAALLIGLAAALLAFLAGPSGYSATFGLLIEAGLGLRDPPAAARWLVLAAVLAGMALSTLQRGSFRPDWRPRRAWLRNLLGGGFMGLGVALTPGGNDALILYGLPGLSPHALPALAAMLLGIAVGLALARLLFGFRMRVLCRDDLFVSDGPGPRQSSPSAAAGSGSSAA